MKKHLLISSVIFLSGCNAHIGYGDLANALRGNSMHAYQTVQRRGSPEECAVHATGRAATLAESEVRRLKSQSENAQASLSKNRAWQNGTCVQVSMRDLPSRPKTLSDDQIAFQAIGSCMDTVMRRAPMADVVQSFASVRKEDYLKVGAAWSKGHKESCADTQTSQVDDWITRMCGVFGPEAKWGCMQKRVETCIQEIAQSCRAPLSAWEAETARIKNEPENLFNQCKQSLRDIEEAEQQLPNAEVTARLNREEHNRLSQERRIVPASACAMN